MSKSFKEVAQKDNAKLMVVDALNLAFRWKHRGSIDFKEEYLATVQSLASSYSCGKIVIAADKGNSSYRREILPEYKANRKEKYETQTEAEKEQFRKFFEEFERTLEYLEDVGYPVLRFDKVEADDIAAYIVKTSKQYDFDHIWLISSDRDWDLLIRDDVSRFSYVTRKEVTMSNWQNHYDLESPEDYISYKCLTGDSGDNVPGIPGVGPKRAASLIRDFGDVIEIYSSIPLPGKYKYIQSLNDNKEVLMKNIALMDLLEHCDEAIGAENKIQIDSCLSQISS